MRSRAYIVYVLTFAALIGGMVLIMTLGESVGAPDDLSGAWIIEWDNAPPPESGEPVMRIAQSGRFFVVTFGERPPMSMSLQDGWTGKSEGRQLKMTLARPLWKLHLAGEIPPDQQWQVPELKLELIGPTRHVGIARRVLPESESDAEELSAASARGPTGTTPRATAPPEPAVPAAPAARAIPVMPAAPAETAHAR